MATFGISILGMPFRTIPTVGESWASLRAGEGTNAVNILLVSITSANATDKWENLCRGIILFNTSSIPDSAVISSAVLSLYGVDKADDLGITPNINIYASTPTSDSLPVVKEDYSLIGSTPLCDSPISYNNFNASGWNDFTLNATGLAAINKTGVSKFGIRIPKYDVDADTPAWSLIKSSYFQADGTDITPKLVVNYRAPKNRIIIT